MLMYHQRNKMLTKIQQTPMLNVKIMYLDKEKHAIITKQTDKPTTSTSKCNVSYSKLQTDKQNKLGI